MFLWQPASPDLSSFSVTVEGQAFGLNGAAVAGHAANAAEAYAHHLAAALNATSTLRANQLGHVVEVMRASDTYEVKLFSATSEQLELSGSEGLSVTQQFSRSRSRQVQHRRGDRRQRGQAGVPAVQHGGDREQPDLRPAGLRATA